MEQLEMTGTKKRRMPKAGMIILAAALAVGALLSIAAGLPARVYNFATGGRVVYSTPNDVDIYVDWTAPVKAENGRLWFEADGQTVDITDMVDETTPYIYERTDPVTGDKGYVIVGGTVEDFGWVECPIIDGKIGSASGVNFDDFTVRLPDGNEVNSLEMTDEQQAQLNGDEISGSFAHRPWFQAALDQLGFEF